MSLRATLDLSAILREVVEPCVAGLLRPGELESIELAWRTVSVPDWPADVEFKSGLFTTTARPTFHDEMRLVLTLIVHGERLGHEFATEGASAAMWFDDLSLVRSELYSELQDQIAESAFGWGQLRE